MHQKVQIRGECPGASIVLVGRGQEFDQQDALEPRVHQLMNHDEESKGKLPHHLRKRGPRGIWWLRFKPPGRRKEVNRSLRTSDKKTAIAERNKILSALMVSAARTDIATMLLAEIVKSDHESRVLLEKTAPGYLATTIGKKQLSEIVREYLDNKMNVKKIKIGSLVNYRISLEHFIEVIGDKEIGAVSPADIEHYLANAGSNRRCSDQSKAKPISARTIANRIKDINALF